MTTKPLLSLLITLTLANAADAGSLTYVVPIDTVTQPGFLPEFNPMLGTLLSVGVVADVSAGSEFLLQDPVSSVEVSASINFVRFPPTGFLLDLGSVSGSATEDFSTPQFFVNAVVDIDSAYFMPANSLSSFYGTDVLNVQAMAQVSAEGQQIGVPSAEGSLTVTYTFSGAGVPEPSSLLIAATGAVVLFGYGCWRRFRSAA